jgi:DNA-binding MarR family transcriptional regulator
MPSVPDADAQPLGYLLYRVQSMLQPAVSAALRPHGITLPEMVCMRILSLYPGTSNAELARRTNVSPQAMNTVVRSLQNMGAVTRPDSVPSGRALPAELTKHGKALLKRALAAAQAAEDDVLAALTPVQVRDLKRMLGTIGDVNELL